MNSKRYKNQISENFYLSEFECNCGKCIMPDDVKKNIIKLVEKYLQFLRDIINEPIHINSGYRCEAYNRQVGGVKYSQHKLGTAADISAESMSPSRLRGIIKFHLPSIPGMGSYDNFTHIDNRDLTDRDGRPARW